MQQLVKLAKIKPAVNQVTRQVLLFTSAHQCFPRFQIYFNPYNYAENKELLEYCASNDIVVEAYSSLRQVELLAS